MAGKYYCPVNGWDCPYYLIDGTCSLGENAPEDCDDAAAIEDFFEDDDAEILIMGGN